MLNQNTLWPQPLASSPSPIHTPTGTPSRTPGTPTVNLPNTTTSAPYNFHGSPSQNPYSFENPGAYYHPSYYYHAPPGHSYTPAFNTILPLHDTCSSTLNAPSTNDHPSGSSQATASAKRGRKRAQGGRAPKRSKTVASSMSISPTAPAAPETQSAASHCGVGPTDSSTMPDPSHDLSSTLTLAAASALPPPLHSDLHNSGHRDHFKTAATDVCYFL